MNSRILIVTYYWPPCGGAGVQRWLKFARYLPQFGWDPVILTVDPRYASFPAIDRTLEMEVPGNMRVEKTKAINYFAPVKNKGVVPGGAPSAGFATGDRSSFISKIARFIRGNFFIPDPRRGWNRFAYKRASELVQELGIRYVITTSPPHSTQLIGSKLKKRFPSIKWIADLRDPWTDIYYYKMFRHTLPARLLDMRYERKVIEKADLLLTVGESLSTLIQSKVEECAGKITVLPNGYDETDFSTLDKSSDNGTIYITYAGTISSMYPIDAFLRAVKKIINNAKTNIIVRFIGISDESQKLTITSILENSNTEFIPYTDHRRTVQYMTESKLLLLVIPDHPENRLIITGKLFEYLRTGNPIICLGPVDGDAAKIIGEAGAGQTFNYNDIEGISSYLMEMIRDTIPYSTPSQFDRVNVTKHLAQTLDRLM